MKKILVSIFATFLGLTSHWAFAETIKLSCNVQPAFQSVAGPVVSPRETVQLDVEIDGGFTSFDAEGQNVSIFISTRQLKSYLELRDYSTADKWDIFVKTQNKNGAVATSTLKLDRSTGNLVFTRDSTLGLQTVTGNCQKASVGKRF